MRNVWHVAWDFPISLVVKWMGKRYRIGRAPNHYVVRDRRGRFKKWTKIMPLGVSADKARKAKKKLPRSKPGYGHRADYPSQ